MMDERIIRFIHALRSNKVRVSLAESADALQALEALGIQDREVFRLALRSTLIKDSSSLPIFDELFSLFFDLNQHPPLADLSDDLTSEEARMIADALRQFNQDRRKMLERLLRGQQLSQEELERLGQMVGLSQADDLKHRAWMVQRMEKALKFKEVRNALRELLELLAEMGLNRERLDQIKRMLMANQEALRAQIRQYAGTRIAENLTRQPPEQRLNDLIDRPITTLTDKELELLRKEVRRLAAALRTRVALRQKRSKSGALDVKATIRANLKHGNVPIVLKHKNRTLKPKLVVLCDISTSMRTCSELMLALLFEMQDQISKTHAFAYIDHLEYISPDFQRREVREAVRNVLRRMPPGHYNTDLGFGLQNFADQYLDTIDKRSTFIIVGDGRNNYNDPRLDLFQEITRRSRRTIWLNPETPALWGAGDSDMLRYFPLCDQVFQAGTLAELSAAIDHLLSH